MRQSREIDSIMKETPRKFMELREIHREIVEIVTGICGNNDQTCFYVPEKLVESQQKLLVN